MENYNITAHCCLHQKTGVMQACVGGRLTPRTPDLEVRGSSLTRRVVSLDKELYSTLSLFTQVYNGYPRHTAWG